MGSLRDVDVRTPRGRRGMQTSLSQSMLQMLVDAYVETGSAQKAGRRVGLSRHSAYYYLNRLGVVHRRLTEKERLARRRAIERLHVENPNLTMSEIARVVGLCNTKIVSKALTAYYARVQAPCVVDPHVDGGAVCAGERDEFRGYAADL